MLRQGPAFFTGSKVGKSLRCGSSDESGSSDIGGDAELITNAFRSNASSSSNGGHSSVRAPVGVLGALGSSTTTTFSGLTPQSANSLLRQTGTLPHPKPSVMPPPPRLTPSHISTGTLPNHGTAVTGSNTNAKKIYV